MPGIGADLLEDCSMHVDRRRPKAWSPMVERRVAGTRTSAVDAERRIK